MALSEDIEMLENLAEASEEARQVLLELRQIFQKKAARVFSLNKIQMQNYPIAPKFQTKDEYAKEKAKFTWQIYKHVDGKRALIAKGKGLSSADCVSYLCPIAKKMKADIFNASDMTYHGKGFYVSISIQELKNEENNNSNAKNAPRRRWVRASTGVTAS
jgi:hypothetical protein